LTPYFYGGKTEYILFNLNKIEKMLITKWKILRYDF